MKNLSEEDFFGIVPFNKVIPNLDTEEYLQLQKDLSIALRKMGYTPNYNGPQDH